MPLTSDEHAEIVNAIAFIERRAGRIGIAEQLEAAAAEIERLRALVKTLEG